MWLLPNYRVTWPCNTAVAIELRKESGWALLWKLVTFFTCCELWLSFLPTTRTLIAPRIFEENVRKKRWSFSLTDLAIHDGHLINPKLLSSRSCSGLLRIKFKLTGPIVLERMYINDRLPLWTQWSWNPQWQPLNWMPTLLHGRGMVNQILNW